jgi:uncharacterized pyridoxal phosphate-containing UPF0001 family protein
VEILAAVKYVALEELGTLAEAGVKLVGENRAQELERKAAAHPGLTWDFIGQLQSRKVKVIAPLVRRIHSVASDSAVEQLARHARDDLELFLQVNIAGEESKAGIEAAHVPRFIADCPVPVTGLMCMPPAVERAEESRPHFARLAELAAEHGLERLSMGTTQDYDVAAAEGATIVRLGTVLYE